jgi:hypothetical protein
VSRPGKKVGQRFSRVTLVLALVTACGGRSERDAAGDLDDSRIPDSGAPSAADAGRDRSAPDQVAPGPFAVCERMTDGRVLLAAGFRAPSYVAAPRAPDDPVVVGDYADGERYHFVDPQTCEVRSSSKKPDFASGPVALGRWFAWRDRERAWLRPPASDSDVPIASRGVPIALYADAEALYVFSALVADGWGVEKNETVREVFVERIRRADLARDRTPEFVATLDLSAISMWNSVHVAGDGNQILVHVAYGQLDVSGPYAILRLRVSERSQTVLFAGHSVPAVLPMGDSLLVQRDTELLLYSPDASPVTLRSDLDHIGLYGYVPGRAIGADSWFDYKLFALPLDGSAPQQLASDVALWAAVSTSNGRVYWASHAGEVWMMVP